MAHIEHAFQRYLKRKKKRAWIWAIGGFIVGAALFAAGMYAGTLR